MNKLSTKLSTSVDNLFDK